MTVEAVCICCRSSNNKRTQRLVALLLSVLGVDDAVVRPELRSAAGIGGGRGRRGQDREELRELPSAELPTFAYTMSLVHRFLEA